MEAFWKPGRVQAQKQLRNFFAHGVVPYQEERDRPDRQGTSRLSAYLHLGQLSAREIWHALKAGVKTAPYRRQIVWRDFAHSLLYHFPHTLTEPMDSKFAAFPWKSDRRALRAWQKRKDRLSYCGRRHA